MKKIYLLTKTLLVAVLLMVGASNVWGDEAAGSYVYTVDFETVSDKTATGSVTGGTKTDATIQGSGSFTNAGGSFGKVFTNVGGVERTNYLLLPDDVLAHSADSKELTIAFWVNCTNEAVDYYWAPMFTAYGAAPTDDGDGTKSNDIPMLWCGGCKILQYNTDGVGWCDFSGTQNVKGSNDQGSQWLDDHNWHYYAVTFTTTSAKVYIDGTIANEWTLDNSTNGQKMDDLFTSGSLYKYICLGGNQRWGTNGTFDCDPAFMFDDLYITNAALTADQIAAIIDDKLNYDYTVKAVDGSDNVLKEITSGKVSKGSSVTVYYPQYINVNGTLYSISANGSYPYYGTTFTPDADDYVKKITYTNTGISVLYFKEGEDLFTNATSTFFASQSKMGYTSSSNSTTYVATTTLPAGTYTIHARFVNSNASAKTTNFRVGSENIVYTYAVSASSQPTVSQEFTITEAGTLYVACEGSSTTGIDWFYITGTPAYTVLGDPYYGTRGDYWNYKTDNATINAGTSYSYKFINHNVTGLNWDNFLLPIYHFNDGNKHDALQIRADWYEGANGKSNVGFDLSADYYTNTISILDGATIDMTVFYTEDKSFRMESVITTSAGAKKYYNFNLANYKTTGDGAYDYSNLFSSLTPVPSSIQTALGANWCWLEVIKEAGAIVTTNALGYTTFSSINKLNLNDLPAGLTAYYALDNDASDGYITLTKATGIVPGETGLILIGEANTVYEIPTSTSEATALSGNLLVACPYREAVSSNSSKYVLVNNNGTMEFQSLEDNGATMPTGKAYLNVSGAGVKALRIVFDEPTSIHNAQLTIDNDVWYDLNGRRLNNKPATKGIFMKNGKKVVMK